MERAGAARCLQSRKSHFNARRALHLMIGFTKRALLWVVVSWSLASSAWADLALATSKNCMTCHAVDRTVLGPSFKDIAAKYRTDKQAVDVLATRIRRGIQTGEGVWGPLPMPANTQVTEAEAKKLATWILNTP